MPKSKTGDGHKESCCTNIFWGIMLIKCQLEKFSKIAIFIYKSEKPPEVLDPEYIPKSI